LRSRFSVVVLLLVLGGLAFAQPVKVAQAAKAPQTVKAVQAASKPAASDAEIEAAIRARFAKSKSGIDKFTVRVQGGVATIEGTTDVVQRKAAATRMAKAAGAKQVINKVEVSAAAKEKASKNLAEGRRRAQVKRSEVPR
jgi:hypothetical protein